MDVRRLEAFCKVHELKSFSKAGQELYLSQPTISAHVSSLEQELGSPLFDRLGRTVITTQAGEILYRHARQVFAALDNAKAEVQLLHERVSGCLAIGGSTIPAHYLLPRILAKFTHTYPDVKVHLKVADTRMIVDQVLEGELILGVVGSKEDIPDLSFLPLMQDDLVIIAAPRLAAGLARAEADDLRSWPWIMREQGSGTRRAFEKGLQGAGLDARSLNVAVTVESTEAVLQCARAGLGVSVTSRLAAEPLLALGEVVVVDVPGLDMPRQFYTVHHQRRHFFPVVRLFLEFLEGAWSPSRLNSPQPADKAAAKA